MQTDREISDDPDISTAERAYRRGCHQTAAFFVDLLTKLRPGRTPAEAAEAATEVLGEMRFNTKQHYDLHPREASRRLAKKGFPGGSGWS